MQRHSGTCRCTCSLSCAWLAHPWIKAHQASPWLCEYSSICLNYMSLPALNVCKRPCVGNPVTKEWISDPVPGSLESQQQTTESNFNWPMKFCRMFLTLALYDASPYFNPGSAFCQGPRRRNIVSSSVPHIRRYAMSICPIDGDIHFDNLVMMVFSRFVHCKFTIFPLWN